MSTPDLKQRKPAQNNGTPKPNTTRQTSYDGSDHPMGPVKHGVGMQLLRIVAFGIYFFGSCLCIHAAQLLGAPLYFINKDYYYAWMAMTKQHFGLLVTTMTQWWSPTTIRISGDKSVAGLLKQDKDGMLEVLFGERAVVMSNHQIYTDWLYLWWIAYTNAPSTHGHIYIILKESLKYVPLIGPAMMFYSFIFMARKWSTDQERLRHRLQKLNSTTSTLPGGKEQLDPMWLLIFPEGTNLSANTRQGSEKFSAKSGIPDLKHQLLPRSTGLQFCLQELRGTVDYLYDCTIAYEGPPPGTYASDIFTLRSVYFQGRPPKSVNMHWRRFAISSLPLDDADMMHQWVLARWREKDALIESWARTGKFPADAEAVSIEGAPMEKEFRAAYINTEVKPRSPLEFLQMFAPLAAATMVGRVGVQLLDRFFGK